jgi:hypothetical protein
VVRVSADQPGVDAEVLRDREMAKPQPTTSREFRCPECGARCTRLTDGHSEAGHRNGCSRRLQRVGGGQRSAPTEGGDGE